MLVTSAWRENTFSRLTPQRGDRADFMIRSDIRPHRGKNPNGSWT
jgi:hypothetical protein